VAVASPGRHDDQSPFGGEAVGANPTDRAKTGTKRSLLTDGAGVPLAVVGDGANRHDSKRVEATLNGVQAIPPDPATEQNPCLDKGFDYPHVEQLVRDYAYNPHIRSGGEEARDLAELPGYRARRGVVERTHSWMNRFRRLLTRWEKKKANFLRAYAKTRSVFVRVRLCQSVSEIFGQALSLIHLACAYITFRAAGVLG